MFFYVKCLLYYRIADDMQLLKKTANEDIKTILKSVHKGILWLFVTRG